MQQSTSVYPPFAAARVHSARYEVGEAIASGGMGTVHRAFDRWGQRQVAYKRLRAVKEAARPRMAGLFQREYDTLAQLSHPNIVEAYDFGFDDYGPYYAMELLSDDHFGKLAPLPFERAASLLRDIASALALLHARRLVHRDVSPKNACLTFEGRAKLIDFGGLTHFGKPSEVVGTPVFIAPECLADEALDQRADLYGLGALAYWLLTGHTHIVARSIDDLPDAWLEPLLAPSRFVAAVPKELDALVLALLQHRPSSRPGAAADVIEQLTRIAKLPPEHDAERVAYSYLQRPPLVARETALSTISFALAQAVGGTGKVVLVEAEQGLGRSALLDAIAVEAQLSGATVLRAGGGLHTAPFSAAHELVRAGLATYPSVAERMHARSSQFVRMLSSEDGKELLVRSAIEASARQAAFSSLLEESLFALSACAPLALLIDDTHGIDGESLALLASMVDALHLHPILLVLSERPGQRYTQPLARAKLVGGATLVRLAPLDEAQLLELVSTVFGEVPNRHTLAAWLFTQTGGNPAHVMELARGLLVHGSVRYTLGTFTLPYDLAAQPVGNNRAQGMLDQLSSASEEARALASLLALHSGALRIEELAAARGSSAREVVFALGELAQRGALLSRGESFCCASESLRAAVLDALPEQARRPLHIALSRALEAHGGRSADNLFAKAEHLLRAGGEEELAGAHLLAQVAEPHKFELGMKPGRVTLLESALTVLAREGRSDEDCIGLLVPLSLAGYYGDLASQRRYLDRTLAALSSICGLALARKLKRFLGARVALMTGLLVAFAAHLLRGRTLTPRSFVQHLESLTGVTGPATAAAACTFDAEEAWRVVAWLEPLAAAPRRSPLFFMREFCVATAELVSARFESASKRYAELIKVYERPVPGIDAAHAIQIRSGCLSGRAQALVTDTDPEALTMAEALEHAGGGAFFAPHAEGVRATYHATRGQARRAAEHRARAETLALQAGTCWSAMSVLTVRSVLTCALADDVVGLVRALADLEQLAKLSTSLGALYELGRGHLDLLRGDAESARQRYERVFAGSAARKLPTYPVERALHAAALSALGDHAGARALCLALLDELPKDERSDILYSVPRQKLALAEAALGEHALAAERLDGCLARDGSHQNPLLLGALHRDRAYVAALAGDRAAFDLHFAAMEGFFLSTENARLIQQCGELLAQARQLGLETTAIPRARAEAGQLDAETTVEPRVESRSARQPH